MILLFLPGRLRSKLYERHSRPLLVLLNQFVSLLICSAICVGLFSFFEKAKIGEAIWQVWQTETTVGYGNAPAQKPWGRLTMCIFGTACIVLTGATITAFFDFRNFNYTRRRLGMVANPFKKGIVIIKFPGVRLFQVFLREVRCVLPNIPICIVDSRLSELPEELTIIQGVHFIKGDALDQKTCQMARFNEQKAVVIFSEDEQAATMSDGFTKAIVEAVLDITRGSGTQVIHSVVDLEDHERLYTHLGSSAVPGDLYLYGLIQEVTAPGTVPLIFNFLRNSAGPNPRTVKPILSVGWTWAEWQHRALLASESLGVDVNFFGILKNGKDPYPCPDRKYVITSGDDISLIVYPGFDWESFEAAMKAA